MQNPISLFRSILRWFRPTRRARSEQPLGNPSQAKEQAVEPLSPERFREMFAGMLADPETRKAIMRSLITYFPMQGGACTSANAISPGDFGSTCTPTGNFTFSSSNVGVGTAAPGTFGGGSGTVLDVIGSTGSVIGIGSSQTSDNLVGDFNFYNTAIGSGDQRIGLIRGNRSGANNSGALQFFTRNGAGGYVSALYITPPGNVGVGTSTPGSFGGGSGQALDVIGSTYANVGIGSSQTSDNLVGDFNFYNTAIGSGDQRIALIRGNRSGANNSGALQFFTRNGAGGYVSALYITPPGNVGVGTTVPGSFGGGSGQTFDVIGSPNGVMGIGSSQASDNLVGDFNFYNTAIGSGDQRIAVIRGSRSGANNSGALQFFTRNAGGYVSALYITPSGKVGIGTSNPAATLDVEGDALIAASGAKLGFYGTTPVTKITVTGSKATTAALTSLLSALQTLGLIVDGTT